MISMVLYTKKAGGKNCRGTSQYASDIRGDIDFKGTNSELDFWLIYSVWLCICSSIYEIRTISTYQAVAPAGLPGKF